MAMLDSQTLPRVGGSSLTQQVLEVLVGAIRHGSFEDGRLPPEDQLAEMLAVSRTTLRRALQSLEQLGLIERRPGRGTRIRRYARPEMFALHGLVPFPVLLRQQGYEVEVENSWERHEEPAADFGVRLQRKVEGPVYELRVRLRADGEPALAMVERFPADVLVKRPTEADLRLGSILLLSERLFRPKIDHAVAAIEPAVAKRSRDGDPLGLGVNQPFLRLDEVFYSAEEVALATSEVSVNPRHVTFSVFRRYT